MYLSQSFILIGPQFNFRQSAMLVPSRISPNTSITSIKQPHPSSAIYIWHFLLFIMTSEIIFLLIVLLFPVVDAVCVPLYPRMFYAPLLSPLSLDFTIMFNTNSSCPLSYATVNYHLSIQKFNCKEKRIEIFNDNNLSDFIHFVQTCTVSVTLPKPISSFSYSVFASSSQLSQQLTAEVYEVDAIQDSLPLKLAVISDWGPIYTQYYTPLNNTLDYLLTQRDNPKSNAYKINGLILNGDYAYDLQTGSGKYYLDFLNQLSRISRFWPIFMVSGNHESTRPKSMYLLENSFQLGSIVTSKGDFRRVQTYRFANRASLIFFDPFLEIYNTSTPQKTAAMINALKKQVTQARRDQFVIVASHYPLMCSQVDPHCRDAMGNMPDLYDWLSRQGRVDLYVGSHMHQYERVYPFVDNAFVVKPSPYERGQCVSVVEAVGGVDKFIIENYYKPQYFSAYSTYNQTGLGILTINGLAGQREFNINYRHYTTVGTCTELDQMTIDGGAKSDFQKE